MSSAVTKYQVIFDHAPLGMVTMDSSGGILFSNQKVEAMLGLSGVDLRTKYLYEFADPEDADALRSMVDEPLVSGEVTFGGRQAPSTWPLRIMRHEAGAFVNDGVVETGSQ